MDDYLNTIPTADIMKHLRGRFSNKGEGFVYAYYTFNDADLADDGWCCGGIGNRPLQIGLCDAIMQYIYDEMDGNGNGYF